MRCQWQRDLALIVLLSYDKTFTAASAASASNSRTSSINEHLTCPTGSVNWITHTLPQQCLRTSRTYVASPSTGNETAVLSASNDEVGANATQTSAIITSEPQKLGATQTAATDLANGTSEAKRAGASSLEARDTETSTQSEGSSATETEADSALQSANFLSFEEWKKQKLGDAAQSIDATDRSRSKTDGKTERQQPGNALDTLGEDSEIDLDFAGFGAGGQPSQKPLRDNQLGSGSAAADVDTAASSGLSGARSKDAGRTCKERFNYASFDCAATVLKTNPRCKSSSSVLVENKDSYMLNECSMENKFLIVELCDHIQIDTVVLANFEFFSSMFRTFRVSASDRYPVKIDKWQTLGTYEARSTREIQAFLVENPIIWAKYIRIEFLTHYGNEYYCPLSLLRVHGTTMMEDYRHQEELARGDIDTSDDELEVTNEVVAVPAVGGNIGPPEAIITPLSPGEVESAQPIQSQQAETSAPNSINHFSKPASQSEPARDSDETISDAADLANNSVSTTSGQTSLQTAPSILDPASSAETVTNQNVHDVQSNATESAVQNNSTRESESQTARNEVNNAETVKGTIADTRNVTSVENRHESLQTAASGGALSNQTNVVSITSTQLPSVSNVTSPTVIATTVNSTSMANSSNASAQQATSNLPAATQPATQESFFKTLSKRLSLLEANATLSLQYIESQSMLLRDAFTAVEKRQIAKTASFLSTLNETVLKELTAARGDYDQLWQSTVLELANQREEGRREREVLNEQVRLLAEEVVGQRRLMAVQVTVVLVVLGLLLFTKAVPSQPGDAPAGLGMGEIRILQSMHALMARGRSSKRVARPASAGSVDEHRSPSEAGARWGWESPFMGSPGATRPTTSYCMDESQEDAWDDLLAFVDENVRPHKRKGSTTKPPHLKQKPLPPAPRPGMTRLQTHEKGQVDFNNDASPLEAPSSHLSAISGENTDSPIEDDTSLRLPAQNGLDVKGRITFDRRSSSFRAAKSAPTTPRVESSPTFGELVANTNGRVSPAD